jgi:hypothetical protein
MRGGLRTCSVIVGAALALHPSAAFAQSDAERAAARDLFHEGDDLQRVGRYADALERFDRAQKLVAAPTNLVRIAECDVAIGRLVEGAEAYRSAIRMPLGADASVALSRAQDQARSELVKVEPRVPRATLVVSPANVAALEVRVDGEPLNTAALGESLPLNPGSHKFVISAAGHATATRVVSLDEGDAKRITVALHEETEGHEESGEPTAAYASFGVGGAGLLAGSIFGVLALGDKSHLSSACNANDVCPSSSQRDISGLSRNAWISNVGFGVAIVGASIGTILLLTRSASDTAPSVTSAHVEPWIGLGTAGLAGAFR